MTPGSFALLAQNMGGGHRDDGSGSARLAVTRGNGSDVMVQPYEPIDQARVICDGRGFVWLAGDALWRWEGSPERRADLPVRGSCDGIWSAADGRVLAAVNGGSPNGRDYASGIVVLDRDSASGWVHPGWVAGRVCGQAGRIFAVANEGLRDPQARLVSLDAKSPKNLSKAANHELWWGGLAPLGHNLVATLRVSPQRDAVSLWTYDVVHGAEVATPVRGAAPVSDWFDGLGPRELLARGDHLLYLQSGRVWGVQVKDGRAADLYEATTRPDMAASLTPYGLVRYWKEGGRYHAEVLDLGSGAVKDAVDGVAIEGPKDMIPWGAAYLP